MAERWVGSRVRLPVLHLPQLIGLALGLQPSELGLRRHVVPAETVLAKISGQCPASTTRLAKG
jgi:succinate dehydrogenase / fumarate reductase cytochrome b subunit